MTDFYPNLPGTYLDLKDGNLSIFPEAPAPRVLILGTAAKGTTGLYRASRPQLAEAEFGLVGTLMRGLHEAWAGGATNIYLLRIGARPARLDHIGDSTGTAGISITTVTATDSAGDDIKVYWNDTSKTLKCWNNAGTLIYDSTTGFINEAYIQVAGSAIGLTGVDIGTESSPVTMSAVTATGTVYTPGISGLNSTYMDLYEALDKAYAELESFESDFVVPMMVYLDTPNIADDSSVVEEAEDVTIGTGDGTKKVFDLLHKNVVPTTLVVEVEGIQTNVTFKRGTGTNGVDQIVFATAPDSGDSITATYSYLTKDALLYLRTYEVDGVTKYEWHIAKTRTVGGNTYGYHEVNFAHQLASYCHKMAVSDNITLGVIGVMPPAAFTAQDINNWIGIPPTYDADGNILSNGTGLLGNKFMVGSTTRKPGFWETVDGWPDGGTSYDVKQNADIGRYLSVVAAFCRFFNTTSGAGSYVSTAAATYAGLCSSLNTNQAPTNKVVPNAILPFNLSKIKRNALVGARYVVFANSDRGVIVVDAPTAATSASDYQRLSTVRIVTELVDRIRRQLRGFIGNTANATVRAAMQTAVDEVGAAMLAENKLQRFQALVTATPAQQVQGEATVEVVVVPAFELRRIHLVVALSAV